MGEERVPLYPEAEGDDEPFVVSEDELREGMDKSHMPGGEEPLESDLEEKAVQKLVDKLREKGKSEAFIEENMDIIREKARKAIWGQDRR